MTIVKARRALVNQFCTSGTHGEAPFEEAELYEAGQGGYRFVVVRPPVGAVAKGKLHHRLISEPNH
jgi:hypothetical protein